MAGSAVATATSAVPPTVTEAPQVSGSVQTTTAVAPEGTVSLVERVFPWGRELSALWHQVLLVFADPARDPRATMIVAGAIVLAILIVALTVLAFAMPRRKKIVKVRTYTGADAIKAREIAERQAEARTQASVAEEMDPGAAAAERRSKRIRSILTGPLPAAVLVVVAFIAGYAMTSTQSYCAETCHTGSMPAVSAAKVKHANCRQCHEAPLVSGALTNSVSRARMIYVAATRGVAHESNRPVDSTACLRCHSKVRRQNTTTDAGLVMSHKAPLASGYPCTSCHEGTGHVQSRSTATMSDCLPCHDGKAQASAECNTCHARSPVLVKSQGGAQNRTAAGRSFPAVRAAKRECTGCHDMAKQCDSCHNGIRMPHTGHYIAGGHARDGAFEGRTRCWRCHDPADCNRCHGWLSPDGKNSGHAPGWKAEHKRSSWKAGCICHSQRNGYRREDQPICILCHAEHYQ